MKSGRCCLPPGRTSQSVSLQKHSLYEPRTDGPRRVHRRYSTLLGLLIACGCVVGAPLSAKATETAGHPDEVVTSIGEAHDLPSDRAAHARVHLIGTVTFYDPLEEELFIQDATGGIYVNTDRPYPIHIGDLIQVDGRTDASYRTEVALGAIIRVLGQGVSLAAPRYSYSDIVLGRGDCRLVRIRGRVRAADIEQHVNTPSVHMDLVVPGGRVEVYLASSVGFHPEAMLDAEVEITGVAGGLFDEKNQETGSVFYVRGADAITILTRPQVRADLLPLTDIDSVFQSRFMVDESQRVRVHGVLTYYKKGDSAVLESASKSLFIQTRQTSDLAVGDVVDAFGFGSGMEYAPSLRDAYIVKTGGTEQIIPRPITYAEGFSGLYSDNLISLTGTLVSQLHRDDADVLVVNSDGHLVSAYVQRTSHGMLAAIGSRISVAGICRISLSGPWRIPYSFHLDVRNEADIRVLAAPSWWTVTHLLEILGGLSVVALVIAIWALVLRRRIVKQSTRISRSMKVAQERSRILEQISSNASPDHVLSTICASIRALMPDFACAYSIDLGDETFRSESSALMKSVHSEEIRVTLTSPDGDEVGLISVVPPLDRKLTADEAEIIQSLTELSNMAVRQNFLYRGLLHHSTHDPLTDLPKPQVV